MTNETNVAENAVEKTDDQIVATADQDFTSDAPAAAGESDNDHINIRYELDVEKLNRKDRRTVDSHIREYSRRFRNVKGPNGERPTLILRPRRSLLGKIEAVLEFPESMKDQVQGSEKAVKVA
jgi:hypothetical protein